MGMATVGMALVDGEFSPFGRRSGLLEQFSQPPVVAEGGGVPSSAVSSAIVAGASASSTQQTAALSIADSYTYEGTRTDIAGGRGPRTTVGKMSDGKYGIRIWDSTGVLRVDNTWA